MPEIEGAILVGGRSRRMGRDKSALLLGGVPLVERVARAMRPAVGRIRLIGSADSQRTGYVTQPDLRPGLGPLSGLHAALATAESDAVLAVACDLPFVTAELLLGLCGLLAEGDDAVVPRVSGRVHPVCAVYRRECVDRLEMSLERGELKAEQFVATLSTRYADEKTLERFDPEGICLKNINTPEDLERAREIAARRDG